MGATSGWWGGSSCYDTSAAAVSAELAARRPNITNVSTGQTCQQASGTYYSSMGGIQWQCSTGSVWTPWTPGTCTIYTPDPPSSGGTVTLAPGATVALASGGQVAVSGGSVALAPGASVSLSPFEFTAQQQADIYSSMSVVFGLFLGLLAIVWGMRRLLRVLGVGAVGGD